MLSRRTLVTFAILTALTGPAMAQARPVTVFAAASLKEALDAAADAYAAQGHSRPVLVYAGSNQLARQIEQGAPADLFVSADVDWMDWLAARQLIASASRIHLLGNRLVMIGPAGSAPFALESQSDLVARLKGGRLALPDPDNVPAGKYAKAGLIKLGLFDQVKDKIAGTENVRVALTLVARGEAPLGIVYATDARAEPKVSVLATFAENVHPRILYPAALTSQAQAEAAPFLAFLTSPHAREIFVSRGFTHLTSPP